MAFSSSSEIPPEYGYEATSYGDNAFDVPRSRLVTYPLGNPADRVDAQIRQLLTLYQYEIVTSQSGVRGGAAVEVVAPKGKTQFTSDVVAVLDTSPPSAMSHVGRGEVPVWAANPLIEFATFFSFRVGGTSRDGRISVSPGLSTAVRQSSAQYGAILGMHPVGTTRIAVWNSTSEFGSDRVLSSSVLGLGMPPSGDNELVSAFPVGGFLSDLTVVGRRGNALSAFAVTAAQGRLVYESIRSSLSAIVTLRSGTHAAETGEQLSTLDVVTQTRIETPTNIGGVEGLHLFLLLHLAPAHVSYYLPEGYVARQGLHGMTDALSLFLLFTIGGLDIMAQSRLTRVSVVSLILRTLNGNAPDNWGLDPAGAATNVNVHDLNVRAPSPFLAAMLARPTRSRYTPPAGHPLWYQPHLLVDPANADSFWVQREGETAAWVRQVVGLVTTALARARPTGLPRHATTYMEKVSTAIQQIVPSLTYTHEQIQFLKTLIPHSSVSPVAADIPAAQELQDNRYNVVLPPSFGLAFMTQQSKSPKQEVVVDSLIIGITFNPSTTVAWNADDVKTAMAFGLAIRETEAHLHGASFTMLSDLVGKFRPAATALLSMLVDSGVAARWTNILSNTVTIPAFGRLPVTIQRILLLVVINDPFLARRHGAVDAVWFHAPSTTEVAIRHSPFRQSRRFMEHSAGPGALARTFPVLPVGALDNAAPMDLMEAFRRYCHGFGLSRELVAALTLPPRFSTSIRHWASMCKAHGVDPDGVIEYATAGGASVTLWGQAHDAGTFALEAKLPLYTGSVQSVDDVLNGVAPLEHVIHSSVPLTDRLKTRMFRTERMTSVILGRDIAGLGLPGPYREGLFERDYSHEVLLSSMPSDPEAPDVTDLKSQWPVVVTARGAFSGPGLIGHPIPYGLSPVRTHFGGHVVALEKTFRVVSGKVEFVPPVINISEVPEIRSLESGGEVVAAEILTTSSIAPKPRRKRGKGKVVPAEAGPA